MLAIGQSVPSVPVLFHTGGIPLLLLLLVLLLLVLVLPVLAVLLLVLLLELTKIALLEVSVVLKEEKKCRQKLKKDKENSTYRIKAERMHMED
jgi:predicted Holliday junction resolvase-like endonuclease